MICSRDQIKLFFPQNTDCDLPFLFDNLRPYNVCVSKNWLFFAFFERNHGKVMEEEMLSGATLKPLHHHNPSTRVGNMEVVDWLEND